VLYCVYYVESCHFNHWWLNYTKVPFFHGHSMADPSLHQFWLIHHVTDRQTELRWLRCTQTVVAAVARKNG